MSITALIFHISISSGKTFLWVPTIVTLTFEFDLLFESFNFVNNICVVSAKALIFHMSIPCDKTFQCVPLIFDPVTLTLEFDPFFENFNLANNY